jgi:hypothetical protein
VFLPSLSINDVSVTEGDSGGVNAVFSATLSGASIEMITAEYATADGSATAPAYIHAYTHAGVDQHAQADADEYAQTQPSWNQPLLPKKG